MIYFTEATVSPPLNAKAGDVVERIGNTVKLKRNGVIVATATIGAPQIIDTGAVLSNRLISSLFVAREVHMPTIATVTSVVYAAPPSTTVYVNYSDGQQKPFTTRQELLDYIADRKGELSDWAKDAMLIAWESRSPEVDNPAWIIGKTLQLDLSHDLAPLVIGVVE